MTTPSRLTLAVPNWNGGRYLEHTLRSLADQGGLVQWWMQDAASKDDSLAIARRYAAEGDTIVSEKDDGQTDALNRAIAAMGGDIIGWINSDDVMTPGAAEAVLEAFSDNPEVDIVVGEVDWIDADGRVTGHHAARITTLEEMLDIYGYWWAGKQWVQPEVFWRRSLWEKAGPLDTRYALAFDFDFWVRALKAGAKVMLLPRTLVQFRLHDAQKSRMAREAADEIRNIVSGALAGSNVARPRLARMLAYDRYQCAQDVADPAARPPLWKLLLRNPDWLLIPEVRRRVLKR